MLRNLTDGQFFLLCYVIWGLVSVLGVYIMEKIDERKESRMFKQNKKAHEIDDLWGWDNNGNNLWNR